MATTYNKSNPFHAKIKERKRLTKEGSTKETYHVVLDLKDSDMEFKVGDSVGILGQNSPAFVDRFLKKMKADGNTLVIDPRSKQEMTLFDFLSFKANLHRLSSALQHHLSGEKVLPLSELLPHFAPLLPRFYSVASSLHVHPEEVHLTVALLTFMHEDEPHYGVASHFLCHLAEVDKTLVPLYVQPARHFALPEDSSRSLIMIGPGTGVAPYRGFLQERIAKQASGKHWLFFGERNRSTDFLYEEFWTDLSEQNQLRLDLAFSRDTPEKTYVQHRMLENAAELWKWIQNGAIIYICGDASRMAKDVEAALLHIFEKQGHMSHDDAKAYLKQLRADKRYLLDVY